MNKKCLLTGVILGIIAIILGAFGAHGLKELISVEYQQTFETGVRYQMYHALFLLLVGNISALPQKTRTLICYLVSVGVLLFSVSIYALATNALSNFDFKVIGFVTPIGGLLLIVAWIVFGYGLLKVKSIKI